VAVLSEKTAKQAKQSGVILDDEQMHGFTLPGGARRPAELL